MSDLGLLPFDGDDDLGRRLSRAGREALLKSQRPLSADEWITLIRDRLAAYRRAQTDLSVPALSVGDLRHLERQFDATGQWAGKEGRQLLELHAELRAEIAKAVPVAQPRARTWA